MHLCLLGANGKYKKAFMEFALASTYEPATEALFKQCFNMGYREMLMELWAYTDNTMYVTMEFQTQGGKKAPEMPPVPLKDATDAEVGRIKGDALRLAGMHDIAHLNLIAPYIRGSRDSQLLAIIGLDELAAGHQDRARKFLEAAAAGKTARTRAYLELARLHFADAKAKPLGPDGKLSNAQLADVLGLAFAAREHPPSLPETYELIADGWRDAAIRPTQGNIAVVDEGVRRFPYDSALVYTDAL